MPTFPFLDNHTLTGTNLGHNRLPAVRRKRLAEQYAAHEKEAAAYRRELKRLLSKSDLKRAAAIMAEVKRDLQQARLEARGNADKWERREENARAKLRRLLTRALPHYRDARKLQRNRQRELQRILPGLRGDIPPIGGIALPDDPPDATVFSPPFPLFDTHVQRDVGELIQVVNRSLVLPETGQIIIDADFDDDEHTDITAGLWGLLWVNWAEVVSECGVSYEMPRTGRLRVTAELKNLYNHAALSLKDNFGFSSGQLWCEFDLYVAVLRPARESRESELLFVKKLTSDGDNVSAVMPDIDQDAPYVLDVTTVDTFNQGEPLWVMVGSSVSVSSILDDMHSHVRALLWWQLERITVSVGGQY